MKGWMQSFGGEKWAARWERTKARDTEETESTKLSAHMSGTWEWKSLRYFPDSGCGREMDVETQEEKWVWGFDVYTASMKTLKYSGCAHAPQLACLPLSLGSLTPQLRDLGQVTALQVPAPAWGEQAEDHTDYSETKWDNAYKVLHIVSGIRKCQ